VLGGCPIHALRLQLATAGIGSAARGKRLRNAVPGAGCSDVPGHSEPRAPGGLKAPHELLRLAPVAVRSVHRSTGAATAYVQVAVRVEGGALTNSAVLAAWVETGWVSPLLVCSVHCSCCSRPAARRRDAGMPSSGLWLPPTPARDAVQLTGKGKLPRFSATCAGLSDLCAVPISTDEGKPLTI
jgi:hypothetical protein